MIEPKIHIKGARELYQWAGAQGREAQNALKTAIKVEGFQRLKELRKEVRSGRPGGIPYAVGLSEIAKRTKTGKPRKNQAPLNRSARLLRYNVALGSDGNIKMSIGFVNTNTSPLGRSWKRLLIEHQEGVDVLYTASRTELGKRMARIGGRLKKSGDPDAKYFFLKKTTGRTIDLPKREIIEPFWDKYQTDAWRNIKENFEKKMRGERI